MKPILVVIAAAVIWWLRGFAKGMLQGPRNAPGRRHWPVGPGDWPGQQVSRRPPVVEQPGGSRRPPVAEAGQGTYAGRGSEPMPTGGPATVRPAEDGVPVAPTLREPHETVHPTLQEPHETVHESVHVSTRVRPAPDYRNEQRKHSATDTERVFAGASSYDRVGVDPVGRLARRRPPLHLEKADFLRAVVLSEILGPPRARKPHRTMPNWGKR